jgi:hypothetical protein
METRVCSWCGRTVPIKDACDYCTNEIQTRIDPNLMTGEERVAEMETLKAAKLEVDLPILIHRLEALIGHGVFDVTLITMWDSFIEEARKER